MLSGCGQQDAPRAEPYLNILYFSATEPTSRPLFYVQISFLREAINKAGLRLSRCHYAINARTHALANQLPAHYYRPVSATCRHARMWPHAPVKHPPLTRRNLPAWGYFDAAIAKARGPVPRWCCCCPGSPCWWRLIARLLLSTAPPSCRSTWSAPRPDGDTWSPARSEHRPQISVEPVVQLCH